MPGSKSALIEVLRFQNPGELLLQRLCQLLNVQIIDYLGSGGMGRCFKVKRNDSVNFLALKTVLAFHKDNEQISREDRVSGKFEKLERLHQNGEKPYVVRVSPNSLTRVYSGDVLLGMGYLMFDVGDSLISKGKIINAKKLQNLVRSLAIFHQSNEYHGDARVHNVVEVGGRFVWIDFVLGKKEPLCNNNRKKCEDMKMLISSIFMGDIQKTDERLKALLAQYAINLENDEDIVRYVANRPQHSW
jgi:tRNA A-37 threonylcarbamoyl transferase component Bud32